MDHLVSIIIPVYNVEKYLSQCIESVINQTYKNLEIILIDDGSPDNCGEICDSYAEKDSRIIVLHKKNEGVSAARNDGIAISKGEYICFVDSDDYVLENYVETLYKTIVEKKVDVVSCGFFRKYGGVLYHNKKDQYSVAVECNSSQGFYDKLCIDFRADVPWNKIFKSSIIKEHHIAFQPGIHPGEDMLFVVSYTGYATSAAYISDALYIYVNSDTSVVKSTENRSFYENNKRIVEILSLMENNSSGYYLNSIRIKKMFALISILYDNKKFKLHNDVKDYKTEVKGNLNFFLSYKISLRIKLRYILMMTVPSLFDSIKKFYRKLTRNTKPMQESECPNQ